MSTSSKWEHYVTRVPTHSGGGFSHHTVEDFAELLSMLGSKGWEFVQILQVPAGWVLFFKRPV